MGLSVHPVREGRVSAARFGRRGLGWCALGAAGGVLLWLRPEAVLPAGSLQRDLVSVIGQFAIFASIIGGVIRLAGRELGACVRRVGRRLEGISEPRFVLLVVGGALGLRLSLAWSFPDRLSSDAYWYHARAVDLLEGRGYVRPGPVVDGVQSFIPTAFWPVGYPVFLAGVYSILGVSWRIGVAVNALLAGANVWVLYRIGVALFERRTARLGVVLICLSPVLWPRMLLSEPLCTFLSLVALWLVLAGRCSRPVALGAGLLMAGATYVRVNALAFTAVLGLVWWIRRGRFWRAAGYTALCGAVLVAALVPWTVRNWQQLGAFVPACTDGGVSLLIGAYEGGDGREPVSYVGPVWERAMHLRLVEGDELAADKYAWEAALSWIAEHPLRWTALGFVKVAWLSLSHPWHPPFELFGEASRPMPKVGAGFKVLCRVASWLVLIGLVCYVRRCVVEMGWAGQRFRWLMVVPVAAWLVMAAQSFVFHGIGRFRLPIEGLLILAGTYAMYRAAERVSGRVPGAGEG